MATPFHEHEGTPLWRAIAHAVDALESSDALTVHGPRAHVVAALCEQIADAGLLSDGATQPGAGTPAGFAAYLEHVARDGIAPAAWQEHMGTRYTDARVEEARRQAVLLQLRLQQGNVSAEQAAEYFRTLARGLRDPAA